MAKRAKPKAKELLKRYLPWIRAQSRRLARAVRGDYEDELISGGIFRLLQALRRYEPSLSVSEDSYFLPRIYGGMVDEAKSRFCTLRFNGLTIRDCENASADLAQELGRKPTDRELSERLGVTEKTIFTLRELDSLTVPVVFGGMENDELLTARLISDRTILSPDEVLERNDVRREVERVLGGLSHRQRMAIVLHYYEGLNLKKIGDILGLSKARISQIHAEVMDKLAEGLRPVLEGELSASKR